MCRKSPLPPILAFVVLLAPVVASAQRLQPEWRQIGTAALDVPAASLATGPLERAWFSDDGSTLFVQTSSGRILRTADFESWRPAFPSVPPKASGYVFSSVGRLPESGAEIYSHRASPARRYALGRAVYRSEDGGFSWSDLTGYRGVSILGGGLSDLAISPVNPDEIVVAGRFGAWRSVDGGLSWSGLNQSLPNLPVRKLLRLPQGVEGLRVLLGDGLGEAEWAPGEKLGWRLSESTESTAQSMLSRSLSDRLNTAITVVASAGAYWYAGDADGRLWTSVDAGLSWRSFRLPETGAIEEIFVDGAEPRLALAVAGPRPAQGRGVHVLRTTNGGIFWDDLTANLPDTPAHGITAHRETGAVYVATDQGLFFTLADLKSAGPATAWRRMVGELPEAPVRDVMLDEAGHHLYTALEGYGVFATAAPHLSLAPRLVNAASLSGGAAAPGSLLSVLGAGVRSARAGSLDAPVLAASEAESQIQVPFEASGSTLTLSVERSGESNLRFGLPLRPTAPAIFVDRDGAPMLLEAGGGVLLDAMNPARSGEKIQILATGLGRVRPEWPTGMPAPIEDPPQVVASVRAYLDGRPIGVTSAVLAPGYVGFYVVEVRMPDVVDRGPAELRLETEGQESNRVRIYLEP